MAKRPYFRLGVGLIVVGAAFIALNLWFLSKIHWLPGIRGGNAGLGVIGASPYHGRVIRIGLPERTGGVT